MATYQLDVRQGRFTVQAFAEGMLSSFGHNPTLGVRDLAGQIDFDPDHPEQTRLAATVKAASLEVLDQVSKKDRQEIEARTRDEVLETAKYPEITFRSEHAEAERIADNQFRLKMAGKLGLHGQERPLTLDVQLRVGTGELRLSSAFSLRQSDFRIKRVTAVAGAIRVKDELKLAFELVAGPAGGG